MQGPVLCWRAWSRKKILKNHSQIVYGSGVSVRLFQWRLQLQRNNRITWALLFIAATLPIRLINGSCARCCGQVSQVLSYALAPVLSPPRHLAKTHTLTHTEQVLALHPEVKVRAAERSLVFINHIHGEIKQNKYELLPFICSFISRFSNALDRSGGCPERTSLKPQLWSQTDTDAKSCGHRRRGSGCDYTFYLRRTSVTLLSQQKPLILQLGSNTWFSCFTRNAASAAEHLKL